jgi:hypothetical protein
MSEKGFHVVTENLEYAQKPSLPISWGGATHVGKVREENEEVSLHLKLLSRIYLL